MGARTMNISLYDRIRHVNPWHFIWLSVLISEIFTAILNIIQSYVWFGTLSSDLLVIGAIDASLVPLIVTPIVYYFIRHTAELKSINQRLQQEIADRMHAEKALAGSEARYRAIVDGYDGLIYICSSDYRIEFMNRQLIARTGRDATGERCYDTLHGLDAVCSWCVNNRIFTGETVRGEFQSTKDNRWYYRTDTPIYNVDGTISMQAMLMDITEHKAMEDDLLKARKLESIGLLAGGIAHDFNNMLAGILGNVELAKLYAIHDEKVYARLEAAEDATIRAKDLTLQLLTFSKGGAPLKQTIDIGEVLKENVIFALRGSATKSEVSIPDGLWPIDADEGQMTQVFNNLIINADQAMPSGGTITVTCGNAILGASDVLSLQGGKYVKISIADQGIGIPKEFLQKIFDPYFTTKKRGSGLGLATCFSIIKRHGGQILVESELGTGTTFHIYLPASEGMVQKKPLEMEGLMKGQGRILVMDDDVAVRDTSMNVLKALGYEVAVVPDGNSALISFQKAKASGKPFDLVIMDLTIPGGLGGKETIKKLLEIDPDAKAIVSSGYSNDPVMAEYEHYGFKGVVAKPFKIRELGETVYRVIHTSRKSR
jgi:two-component system, cell cycle sensor histidine kinase and response regulator CckA